MANCMVILVTHHVELVFPGTYYIVCMLDGCIDAKGTVKNLCVQGILDHIVQDSTAKVKEEEPVAATEIPVKAQEDDTEAEMSYWMWFMLGILIACSQGLGVTEKLWVWVKHMAMVPSVLTENEALMNSYVPYHNHRHYSNNYFHANTSGFNPITLPDVHKHPLFYTGVYAMIGFATAAVTALSTAIHYNRALKASRSTFYKLLMGVMFGKDIETIDTNLVTAHISINRFFYCLLARSELLEDEWLLLNFDGLGGLAVLTTTLLALSGYISVGTAGLCITSAMTFTTSAYWACWFWTTLELDLNSVEHVVEYLDLPQEPPAIIESSHPPAYWPSSSTKEGLLTIKDLAVEFDAPLNLIQKEDGIFRMMCLKSRDVC
ncbi:uncharacterized protein BJ212DRAFT_1299137 [Suillus subaureus]|uniref:ABC transmembrane type-1 domain-containing protein n=1 Tax=Suillus subaureus TaxID=48587 RepID=A0A9P7JEC4_9AGAM|nr:uncharacterized protein BJ212DRAFT_1299137 [Suillus subaureus]KAG1817598.1 hypothetical protein BJ212DRAFT_1299137 [Suillus subaureus]